MLPVTGLPEVIGVVAVVLVVGALVLRRFKAGGPDNET
jgi:hypothetical protein